MLEKFIITAFVLLIVAVACKECSNMKQEIFQQQDTTIPTKEDIGEPQGHLKEKYLV